MAHVSEQGAVRLEQLDASAGALVVIGFHHIQCDQSFAMPRHDLGATGQVGQELLALQHKNVRIEEELAMLQKKNVLAEIRIATLRAQVAAYETASAVVVWDKNQKSGVLQLDRLPPPAPGKDYQLWVIDPNIAQPVSAGLLAVPNDGLIRTSFHPATPIESASAFAISVEKAGGAPKPEGQIILVGK